MTALTLNAASCRKLAETLAGLPIDDNGWIISQPAEQFAATDRLLQALRGCPDGARVHITIEPLPEETDG